MNNILEDQKIHYIVKDYQRMYEGFHALVEENKELKKEVEELKLKVEHLHSNLEKKEKADAKKKLEGCVKSYLSDSISQSNALYNKAKLFLEQTERLYKNLEELNIELRK